MNIYMELRNLIEQYEEQIKAIDHRLANFQGPPMADEYLRAELATLEYAKNKTEEIMKRQGIK